MYKTYQDKTKLRDISKDERIKLNKLAIDGGFMSFDKVLRVNEMCINDYECRLLARSKLNETLLQFDNDTGEIQEALTG